MAGSTCRPVEATIGHGPIVHVRKPRVASAREITAALIAYSDATVVSLKPCSQRLTARDDGTIWTPENRSGQRIVPHEGQMPQAPAADPQQQR